MSPRSDARQAEPARPSIEDIIGPRSLAQNRSCNGDSMNRASWRMGSTDLCGTKVTSGVGISVGIR